MGWRTFSGESTESSRITNIVFTSLCILAQISGILMFGVSFYWPFLAASVFLSIMCIAILYFMHYMAHSTFAYRFRGRSFSMTGKKTWRAPNYFQSNDTSFKSHMVFTDAEVVSVRITFPLVMTWRSLKKSPGIKIHYRLSGGATYSHEISTRSIETDYDSQDLSAASTLLCELETCLGTERIADLTSWQRAKIRLESRSV